MLDLAILGAFVLLGVLLVLRHEPWRDEADSWLIARDAPLGEIIHRAPFVGTPALWALVLVPFAKLGLSYGVLGFVNLGFAAAAVAIFVMRAPFPPLFRVLVVFSFFVSYEYAVIARSYAMSMLLLFTLAALDARRFSQPVVYGALLALLFNTNTHGIMLAVPIAGLWAWDLVRSGASRDRAAWAGLALAAVGAAVALVQLLPPIDGQLQGMHERAGLRWIPISLSGALFPTLEHHRLFMVAATLLFVAVGASLWRHPRALVFLLLSSLGLWGIFCLKYPGALRHWGFLLLAMIFALWIAGSEERSAAQESTRARSLLAGRMGIGTGLLFALVWSVYVAALHWRRDFQDPFSGSREMARFIADRKLTTVPIAAWPAPHAEAVLPYLPGLRFYYPGIRAYGSYMKWDRTYEKGMGISEEELFRRIDEAFPRGRDVLLLSNRPLGGAETNGFAVVHVVVGNVVMGDEQYVLYGRPASP